MFYLPGAAEGELCAHGIVPSTGAVLVFPHGDAPHPEPGVDGGFLVHEGSVVTAGVKCILRTGACAGHGCRPNEALDTSRCSTPHPVSTQQID